MMALLVDFNDQRLLGRTCFGRILEGRRKGEEALLLEAPCISSESFAADAPLIDEEIASWSAVRIPGVLRPLELVLEGDSAYLAVERGEGVILASRRKDLAAAGDEQLLSILMQALDILESLHRERDGRPVLTVTPWSFLITADGRLSFFDFTPLLRVIPSSNTHFVVPGVPGFASPEHQGRGSLQPASDIYGLGAVFYYLLTGKAPLEALDLLFPDVEQPSIRELNPDAAPAATSLAEMMMEVILERRPRECGAVREALRALTSAGEPAPEEPPAPESPARPARSSSLGRTLQREFVHIPLFALILGVLLFFLAAGGGRLQPPPVAPAPSPTAPQKSEASTKGPHWIKNEKDGSIMILVPGGPFAMGSEEGEINERPCSTVDVPSFYIDKFEITNEQYSRFVARTRYHPQGPWHLFAGRGRGRHPAVALSWNDANAYARWAGKRLPTEAEWEKAARGGDMRKWPWGNTWDPTRLNCMETALGNTAPVGSYPKGVSPYGVHDMAGNVWEWTTDWLLPYPRHELEGKEIVGAEFKVVRGGSRNDGELQTRCSARSGFRPDEGNSTNGGFRCALSAE